MRFAGPEGEEYIINTTSLRGNDGIEDRKNSPAASKALENLRETLDQGDVSIEDLSKKYDKYKVQDYPDDIKDKVAKQNSINNELCQKLENLRTTGNYGMVFFDGATPEFDSYKQKNYSGGGTAFISQSDRDSSGRDNGSYSIGINYQNGSKNVEKIEMTDPSMSFENKKVLTMDILVKKGYSQESAQALMNDIANEALNGKPLKDLYNEKLRQIDEPSQNRAQSQKQERLEQQNNNLKVGYLREMKRNGGR